MKGQMVTFRSKEYFTTREMRAREWPSIMIEALRGTSFCIEEQTHLGMRVLYNVMRIRELETTRALSDVLAKRWRRKAERALKRAARYERRSQSPKRKAIANAE